MSPGVPGGAIDDGDPDRCADIDAVTTDDKRRADRGKNAFGNRLQRIGVRGARHDDGKLVAAQARNEIVIAHDLA
jgi:hypothetical protein